ncbi:amidohydrolase family protein [Aureobasidium pullulans]|uniref:Amidohydrolase family protein n=1 Tax=Aureobasidium pullulans TaxID=5580 RepID=A0A4S9L2H9_AURPU|nr:amidohydrolase family protein [Aureobasidium pullulans]
MDRFDLARRCNEYCSELRDDSPKKWGFFAAHPSLLNTEAALAEVAFALDVLDADGPIWKELGRRQAVVFVHPTHPVDTTKVNESMPQPLIDYPHETTRTATDMIIAGTRRKYPGCKRISNGSKHWQQAMADFKSFYYDLALSSSLSVLQSLLTMVPHDQILYGASFSRWSDTSYAPPSIKAFAEKLANFEMEPKLRSKMNYGNALATSPTSC